MIGGALILAAGEARRFGEDKRRARLPVTDRTLLEATIDRYRSAFAHLRAVLRDGEHEIAMASGLGPHEVIYSSRAAGGMGYSLADGIATVSDWDYAFIALADMPFVHEGTLRTLRQAMQAESPESKDVIVAPGTADRQGHPMGFSKPLFGELEQLTGDVGARDVVHHHRDDLIRIEVQDPGIFQDVDRPEDLTAPRP
ncbi:MAG: nucleotidyltransferase family protein [Pseudomonadales bacterium]